MAEIGILEIQTEAHAWSVLETTFRTGKLPVEAESIRLNIGPWPGIRLRVEGDQFYSSINTKMMEAFIELQNNIYRGYGKLFYNLANGRVLTKEEKRVLEIIVQVNPGSSDIWAPFEGFLKTLVQGAVKKMEAKHFVIIGIGLLLTWSSDTIVKNYFASQIEQKKLETQITLSKEESRRLEIMKEATQKDSYLKTNIVMTEEVYNKMLKAAVNAKSINIGGQTLNRMQVNDLIRPERSTSQEVRLDGEFRILKVDSSNVDNFKVELQDANFRKFWALLQDATVEKEKSRTLLQEAEWKKKRINLTVNAKQVKGDITSATILDVKEIITEK